MEEPNLKPDVEKTLGDITRLPTLPAVANRAIALAYDPNVDFKALADEISRDVAITASIIRMSNSSYFSPSRQIRSVQEAIVTLGLKAVKDIIVMAATEGILKIPMESYKIEGNALWEHSLLVAETSARIARIRKTSTPPDVAFTAGILHDIGKVVLVHFFKRIYRYVALDLENNPTARFADLERKYLGYTHNEIGGKILKQWGVPDELAEAATMQYTPEKATLNPELASIIHIANLIVLQAGVGVDIGGMNMELSRFALTRLGLTDVDLQAVYGELPEMIETLKKLQFH